MKTILIFLSILILSPFASQAIAQTPTIAVGSKAFTEGYVLAELISQTIEASGEAKVNRRFGMGGTGILIESLKKGEISLYPEYTGTLSEVLLKTFKINNPSELRRKLEGLGFVMSNSFGFNNTYALAIRRELSERYHITKISDLKDPKLQVRIGFSHEFMNRSDGYSGLERRYQLPKRPIQSLTHSLAYAALSNREIDLTDTYTTDAKLYKLNLVVLDDDLHFFPNYEAIILTQKTFVKRYPHIWQELKKLEGKITQQDMLELNSQVELNREDPTEVISRYLTKDHSSNMGRNNFWKIIWKRTKEHLYLVLVSITLSTTVGLPLGLLAARVQVLGRGILLLSGLIQTIPSLALLSFLIPWFGIGLKPSLVALFLYGLLPIVLNTYIGLKSIDSTLLETSRALGLSLRQQLFWIEIPLASRSILSGIQASTIIGIGTATLAALIGAGGYGVPIVTGLSMNDTHLIFLGAVPSAIMALLAYSLFAIIERIIIPRGLQ